MEQLHEDRKAVKRKKAILVSQGLARPPAPAGFHFCNWCGTDVPDEKFELRNSITNFRIHYALILTKRLAKKANLAAKPAALEPKKAVLPSNDGATASIVAEVDTVLHSKTFSTLAAALEYVELLGHTERVMYIKRSEDKYGNFGFLCHCAQKLYDKCPGMFFYRPF